MSSGLGFVPGALMVAGASATGKLVDEAIESAEGLQRQTLPEIGRDAAFEGAFALLGEGEGRGISNLFGRIIKGPGGEANEALRTEAREMLKRGIRPTIAGASATGKLVDEAIESAEGLQRQTLPEIGRDAAFEGAFALLGEGEGRGISNLFGRIIKGPGGEAVRS